MYTEQVTKREQAGVISTDLLVANTWTKQVSTVNTLPEPEHQPDAWRAQDTRICGTEDLRGRVCAAPFGPHAKHSFVPKTIRED